MNIILPKLGESIVEATVLKIHKQVGDAIKLDETFMEIATDKVDTEVPSTAEGIVEEILCKEDDVVKIGAVIAKIRTSKEEELPQKNQPILQAAASNGKQHKEESDSISIPYLPTAAQVTKKADAGRFYSPLVMNIASSEGIGLGELEKIAGTGNDGRVTKADILNYVEQRKSGHVHSSSHSSPVENTSYPTPPTYSNTGNTEVIEMDRMRRLIADHMVKSKATSAHVTSFAEADVTNLVTWRENNKTSFEKREGEKITFTPLFIEAIVKCLKKYPLLNSSVIGQAIHIKKDINIGMATALPNGNLIVPVIQYADQYNIIGLTKQVNRLAKNARNGQLQPNDIQNGTFTFTNIGTFGSLMGTPIINQPQVAILAIGAIKKKPVVIETEQGDSVGIRQMMFVSMSYDHRIIDGALGSMFLHDFVKALEEFDPQREI